MIHRPATPEIGTQLANLYHSSHDLIDRFGLTPNLGSTLNKFAEEVSEFSWEGIYLSENFPEADRNALAAEAADVLVTVFNVVRAAGVSEHEFVRAIRNTWRKNDAKDWTTHYINDEGLIARRGK